jgi:hypothetical protein
LWYTSKIAAGVLCPVVFKKEELKRSVLLIRYDSDDEVKKTEMGRTCSTYRDEERC